MRKILGGFIIVLSVFAFTACEEDTGPPGLVEAEILGQDYTRWICGGGWVIAAEMDTFTVHEIPDEEVMAVLTSNGYTEQEPVKVRLALNNEPTSTCAIQFDRVRELTEITLRK